jgi:F0F1-type ATP synthase membrane subunit b/b'
MRLAGLAGEVLMVEFLTVLAIFVLLALIVVAMLSWPLIEAVRERQRVEQETRIADWRLRQLAQAAMQRLLDEARQRP